MPKKRTDRPAPDIGQCLKELKSALKELPEGDKKKTAKKAIVYLEKMMKGEIEPLEGGECPRETTIFR